MTAASSGEDPAGQLYILLKLTIKNEMGTDIVNMELNIPQFSSILSQLEQVGCFSSNILH